MTAGGQIPPLRRWHVPVLRLVIERPGITAAEVGRLFRHSVGERAAREWVATHELLELKRMGLVERDACPGGRWSPALFADMALEQAKPEQRP